MSDEYYEINPAGLNDLSKPYASFHYGIRWKPSEIAGSKNANGYIVQEIEIDAPEYLSGFNEKRYYEAWKVQGGAIVYPDNILENEDDIFSYPGEGVVESLNKSGKIIYYAKVFWIDEDSLYFPEVDKWRYGVVVQAGNLLKSSLVFNGINECKYYQRKTFNFEFSFEDSNIIKKIFLEIGRNFYKCERKYERQNFDCYYRGAFIREGMSTLFESIISELENEYKER